MSKPELYMSFDVEADGRIPGKSSMINFGAVFYEHNGKEIAEIEFNLFPLPSPATPEPKTQAWWEEQFSLNPALKERLMSNRWHPRQAMLHFNTFVRNISTKYDSKIVPMAYPAGFDWTFLMYYLVMFGGESPFGFACLDIKTYLMARFQSQYKQATKGNTPKRFFDENLKHTHSGLDDAREQGRLFFNLRDSWEEEGRNPYK